FVGTGFVRFAGNGETWTWRPELDPGWRKAALECSPPARWADTYRPAMAYDDSRDVIVLFGGRDRNDTWTFDGSTWAPAAGAAASMAYPRARHTATLLADGRVLVVGGLGPGRGNSEIYDPGTNNWSPAGNLISARANHQAVRLADGRVLVMGGRQPGRPLSSAEIFDPQLRTWTSTASLLVARDRPQAVLLSDGKVLVTGGVSVDVGGSLDAAVLFGSPLAPSEI